MDRVTLFSESIDRFITKYCIQNGSKPFVIGIAGGSGSGKTTLAKKLCEQWSDLRVKIIAQDEFFKNPTEMPHYYSAINKDFKPSYNEPHSYKQNEMFSSCKNIAKSVSDIFIIEGITVFWFEGLRDLMDLKIYIDVDADERVIRRIRRNMKNIEDFDKIVDYYLESVRWQHTKYNESTKCHADIIISGGMAEKEECSLLIEDLCLKISSYFNKKTRSD
tara:strand:- start:1344 stop:2000 length:657 start_codon:yes stop_codon:yes gene_type:complete